jgi:pimeloyl-ACP methyl ester carboxylesterase
MRKAMNKILLGMLLLALAGGAGCATSRHEVFSPAADPRLKGIVFAVDGAGGFQSTTQALSQAVAEAHLPLGVVPVEWSHGYGRILADQIDWPYARECGCRLAAQIAAYRQAFPQNQIVVVAHSAGSAATLAAAEALSPGSIDRIILLSPSISSEYDLRPALHCVRDGIDVFYSTRDTLQLGLAIALVGTADGCWGCAAAGRVGFQPQIQWPEDGALYAKLRQHPWNACLAWTGNGGGHYGGYRPDFLKAYVLPLLDGRTALGSVDGNF